METEVGRNLILWTVRLSVALYAVAVWRFLFHRTQTAVVDRRYLLPWGSAWLLCVIHVIFAYHFEHKWSQSAAEIHTAEMTERVVGLFWAGGLYINYLFLAWWGLDVWKRFRTGGHSTVAMHGVAAFMMFNATVVFGPKWWIIPTALLAAAVYLGFRNSRIKSTAATSDSPASPKN